MLLAALLGTFVAQSLPGSAPSPVSAPRLVRGRVVGVDGVAIAGAGIAAGDARTLCAEATARADAARSAADGTFALALPQGLRLDPQDEGLALLIAAPGHATAWLTVPGISLEAQPAPMDLGCVTLARGSTLRGMVTGPGGRPLVGARVWAMDLLTPYSWRTACYATRTLTRDNGVFTLPGVAAGALEVRIEADGFGRRVVRPVRPSEPVTAELEPTGFVAGRLTGKLAAQFGGGVRLRYEWREDSILFPIAPDGSFRVPLPFPGRFVVVAEDAPYSGLGMSEMLAGPAQDVSVPLAEPDGALVVRARDRRSGRALAAFQGILVRGSATRLEGQLVYHMQRGLTPASRDGVLRLLRDSALVFDRMGKMLLVCAEGYRCETILDPEPGPGGELVVELEPGPALLGQVLAADGTPRPGVVVGWRAAATEDGPDAAQVLTDGQGRFRWTGPWAGDLLLHVRDEPGLERRSRPMGVDAGAKPRDVQVQLSGTTTVRGRATGAAPGARLRLFPREEWARAERMRALAGIGGIYCGDGWQPIARDGTFALPAEVGADPYVIAQWVPSSERNGPALVANVAKVGRVPGEPLTVDLAPHAPGRIVARVSWRGPREWGQRLVLTALRKPAPRTGRFEESLPFQRWSELSGERCELLVAPGNHDLTIADLGTGLALWSSAGAVPVQAGQDATVDVDLDIVCLALSLRGPGGEAPPAEWLRFLLGAHAREEMRGTFASHGERYLLSGWAICLLDAPPTVQCLVPVGPVRLHAETGYNRLGIHSKEGTGGRYVTSELFEVPAAPSVQPVTLPWSPPFPVQTR